jgi:hypothetical protein
VGNLESPGTGSNKQRDLEWLLFVVVLAVFVYVLPRWADWNANSRIDVAYAVVDDGTWAIDNYYLNTGDYAFFEGHYYSDKPPGTSFLAIPLYALYKNLGARQITDALAIRLAASPAFASTLDPKGKGLISDSVYRYGALILTAFFITALPSALLAVLLFRFVSLWSNAPRVAFAVALAYSIATPAFAYANNLYSHQTAGFLLVAAFYFLFQGGRGTRVTLYALLAGFMLGAAVITEYQTALIAGALGLYAIYRLRDWRLIAGMWIAVLPPLALAAFYNWSIFHTPLPVGYLYSPLYSDLHHTGLVSLTYPKLSVLAELMFGPHRGLFLIAPWLLLSLPGFFYMAGETKLRAEFFVCGWSVVSFWLFNSSSAMWQGGFAVGPRYLLPMLPFMVLPVGFVLQRMHTTWARVGVVILFLASTAGVWTLTLGGQEFPQYQPNPWLEYSIPNLLRGEIARNVGMLFNLHGFASLLPLVLILVAAVLFFVWHDRQSVARRTSDRLADRRVVPR